MRHERRGKARPDQQPAWTVKIRINRLCGAVLTVGLVATAMVVQTHAALAQQAPDEPVLVDVSDPSITIDLSVLNDGGLTPYSPEFTGTAPAANVLAQNANGAHGAKAPGARMPVSMLYIQPTQKFRLPAQTKPLVKPLVKPVIKPAPLLATNAPAHAPPSPPTAKPVAAAITPPPPPTLATSSTASETPTLPAKAPAAITKVEKIPAPEPAPVATPPVAPVKVTKTVAPVAPPVVHPSAPPAQPKITAVQASPTAKTPPPLALPKTSAHDLKTTENLPPVPAPAPVPKPQTAPAGSTLVVDLPPQDSAAAPGVASLPSATGPLSDGDSMRIVFAQDSSKLPAEARTALKTMSERMRTQDNLRLQLLAYAGDTDTSASAARRLSLSRALAVRSFLIESGIRSTRIDVRALGNKSTNTVTERVDITVVER